MRFFQAHNIICLTETLQTLVLRYSESWAEAVEPSNTLVFHEATRKTSVGDRYASVINERSPTRLSRKKSISAPAMESSHRMSARKNACFQARTHRQAGSGYPSAADDGGSRDSCTGDEVVQRTVQHLPVPQLLQEVVEVVLAPTERVQQRTVKHVEAPVPHIMEETAEVALVPRERVQ